MITICDTRPLVAYLNRNDGRKGFSVYRRNDRQVIPFVAPPRG